MERYLNLWAESLPQLLGSTLAVTIPLSLISFALALLVGIVSAGARTSRFAPGELAGLAVYLGLRGTPLLVQRSSLLRPAESRYRPGRVERRHHHDEPAHRRVRAETFPFRRGGVSPAASLRRLQP